jgi:hypothetical protein
MTTSPKSSEPPAPSNVRWPNVDEALKLMEDLQATSDPSEDTSDWEELKKLLDEDRLSGRKLFSNG